MSLHSSLSLIGTVQFVFSIYTWVTFKVASWSVCYVLWGVRFFLLRDAISVELEGLIGLLKVTWSKRVSQKKEFLKNEIGVGYYHELRNLNMPHYNRVQGAKKTQQEGVCMGQRTPENALVSCAKKVYFSFRFVSFILLWFV